MIPIDWQAVIDAYFKRLFSWFRGYVKKEEVMFQVTEKAGKMIKTFLADHEEIPSIRIVLHSGGWGGPSLGMALDGPRENDETFNDGGITYLIDNQLFEQVKPINIDYVYTPMGEGFQISSSLSAVRPAGSSCSCTDSGGYR